MSEPVEKSEILVIEDSKTIAAILKDWITRLPWQGEKEAVIFENAEAGLAYLEKKAGTSSELPVLIILDLELPGQHGLEFLKKIKAHPDWRSIPVIVNSSSEKPEDITGTYRGGGVMFMKKANDEKILQEVIQQLRVVGILKK